MTKRITRLTAEGLEYVDEEGNARFIDFLTCSRNWHVYHGEDPDLPHERMRQYVGWRKLDGEPPYFEFFTEPRTRIEFNYDYSLGREDAEARFYELQVQLKRLGWHTVDIN